ncbi:MAG: gliding motility lipoprotein GldH [Bacteroidia bacterium]|nr:gliding motility lipoprotein GldH [Bacteroidia bacterium]
MKRVSLPPLLLLLPALCIVILCGCSTADLYEKSISIPRHQWKSDFTPEFIFDIKDTTAGYQLFFIIRHTEKYNYKNIWVNFYYQPPGDTAYKEMKELQLATDKSGWLGTGMGDIYEHRILLTENIKLKAGEYHFRLEHIMREDPLENVLNVGLRVEKKN